MNVSPEHAQVIRDALAAGLTECDLVVEGDEAMDDQYATVRVRPADWVALTGACELCEGRGYDVVGLNGPEPEQVRCDECWGDRHKRVTLTVEIPKGALGKMRPAGTTPSLPLAVATVKVLPVRDASPTCPPERHLCVQRGRLEWAWRDVDADRDDAWYGVPFPHALHRQPVPDKDYVIHLTNLEAP